MPRSWATCAIGRFDSNTRRTARSRNSSGYFLGLDIAGASPSARTEPGIGASNFLRVLQEPLLRDGVVRSAYAGLEEAKEALDGLRVRGAVHVDASGVVDPAVPIASPDPL